MNKGKNTCNRFRVLGNVGMVAGFFVLCVALEVGIMAEKAAVSELAAAQAAGLETAAVEGGLLYSLNWLLPRTGCALMAGGFLCKLLFWRCPRCGCHLTLCVRGGGRECPGCGEPLFENVTGNLEKEELLQYNNQKAE